MTRNKLQVNLSVGGLLLLLGMFLAGCSNETAPTAQIDSSIDNPTALSKGGIVHMVSVGGADMVLVPPGGGQLHTGNANFSLVAFEKSDGSVTGQYTDQFGHGNGGFHAIVTCLSVNGNEAWVSGVITHGGSGGTDWTGLDVITRVVDNGKSGDQISYSYIGWGIPCDATPDFLQLFDVNNGQVKVK